MKKYIVEFTHLDGKVEEVAFTTDRIDWTIDQYRRNRAISNYQILEEGSSSTKQMLLG